MKILTMALLGAGGYYLYKKGQAAKAAAAAAAPAPAPVATLSMNPAPQITPNMAIGAPDPVVATAVAPPTSTFGTLGGTCFSSKRGMGNLLMTFVRAGKASLGPKGRNVLYQGQGGLGYVGDDHAFTRGPGAIASVDAASPRRRQARARHLAADARRDRARARVAMGALPLVSKAAVSAFKKTVLPGMKIASQLVPGTTAVKYPGQPGHNAITFGGPGPQGVTGQGKVMGYGGQALFGARAGKVLTYAGPQIFGLRQTGVMSPGQITIPGTAPSVGTTSSPIMGGGGGGGGDGTQIDDGGGDTSSTDSLDTSSDGGLLTEPGGDVAQIPVSQIASQTTPAPGPVDTAAPDNTTRNWLLAGAALVGVYYLFKKKR